MSQRLFKYHFSVKTNPQQQQKERVFVVVGRHPSCCRCYLPAANIPVACESLQSNANEETCVKLTVSN